jgi:hypothetical protein
VEYDVFNMEGKMEKFLLTDAWSRVVLPGHANQQFLVEEFSDGSIRLEPARVVSEAQYEYDNSPELRGLLSRAMNSERTASRRRPA